MKSLMNYISTVIILILLTTGCSSVKVNTSPTVVPTTSVIENTGKSQVNKVADTTVSPTVTDEQYDVVLYFPTDRYPETAKHVESAIANGESPVCTIDRSGAEENRKESLVGIETRKGYDRDEWPMAMCSEGGSGADVEYVISSDNRGSGSWVGNQLSDYKDGTRVLFVFDEKQSGVSEPSKIATEPSLSPTEVSTQDKPTDVVYSNCTAVREAGAAPLYKGDPGYSTKLDRDGDGVACE